MFAILYSVNEIYYIMDEIDSDGVYDVYAVPPLDERGLTDEDADGWTVLKKI